MKKDLDGSAQGAPPTPSASPEIIPIGTMTKWGRVAAIGRYPDGERWYMMNRRGSVSLMAGSDLETPKASGEAASAEPVQSPILPSNGGKT